MSEKESSKRIRLTVEGGPTREFSGDRTFVIGRSQNADFSIPHPNLSREHVRFSLSGEEVCLEDLGSANGTFVQGQRIPSKSTVMLKPHHRVLLGTGSNVVLSFEVVEGYEAIPEPEPKGDADLPTARERTLAAIVRNQKGRSDDDIAPFGSGTQDKSKSFTRDKGVKMELDFPAQHFPHEVKKEKMAELRILEAKKERVLEDIQYKEREIDDLRTKIRTLREESLKLKDQTEGFKRELKEQSETLLAEIGPLSARKEDLQKCVQELDLIYEEKIDTLETGFRELKQTLEESHSARLARADKDFKEKARRLDSEYANKLSLLEKEIEGARADGEKLRDTLLREKTLLEESLRKVRADAEKLAADRKLEQVRIDTETAKLQGKKLKLENEIEEVRQEREKVQVDLQRLIEQGNMARGTRDEARVKVEESKEELATLRKTIGDIKRSEAKNLERIEDLKEEVADLEKRAEGIRATLKKADVDAEMTRKKAKEEMDSARRSAQEQLEAERVEARRLIEVKVLALREAATAEALETQEKARIDASAYLESKKRDADEIFSSARIRATELEASSRKTAENAVADVNVAMEERKRAIEAELTELRRKTEQEIRLVRGNALADIEAAKDRESREFNTRLRTRAKSIADQVDRIVGSKLATQFGVTMDPVSLRAFSEEIHQIVETVIGTTKSGNSTLVTAVVDKTRSTVMTIDNNAQDRAIRYWKRMGIAASVLLAFGAARAIFPDAFSWAGKKMGSAFEVKDNTDVMVKRMLRDRQLAMTFVTEQDRRIRDSYTDNILYTEAFAEMKEDVETQKAWTLGLNKFFQTDLGLTEKAIVQFGSAEGRMVRELIELRKSIVPNASSKGIGKMRETEATYLKEIKFVMHSDANWRRYLDYQRTFYLKYVESLASRKN